jgi:hypothetical protein
MSEPATAWIIEAAARLVATPDSRRVHLQASDARFPLAPPGR